MVSSIDSLFGKGLVNKAELIELLAVEADKAEFDRRNRVEIEFTDSKSCGIGMTRDGIDLGRKAPVRITIGTASRNGDIDPAFIDMTDAADLAAALFHELEHADLFLSGFGHIGIAKGVLFESLEETRTRLEKEADSGRHGSDPMLDVPGVDRELRLALKIDRMLCRDNPRLYGVVPGEKDPRDEYHRNLNEYVAECAAGHGMAGFFAGQDMIPSGGDEAALARANSKLFGIYEDKLAGAMIAARIGKGDSYVDAGDYGYHPKDVPYFVRPAEPLESMEELDSMFRDKILARLDEPYDIDACERSGSYADDLAQIRHCGTPDWKACFDAAAGEADAARQRRMLGAISLVFHPDYAERYSLSKADLVELDFEKNFGFPVPKIGFVMNQKLKLARMSRKDGVAMDLSGAGTDRVSIAGIEDGLEPVDAIGSKGSPFAAALELKARKERSAMIRKELPGTVLGGGLGEERSFAARIRGSDARDMSLDAGEKRGGDDRGLGDD